MTHESTNTGAADGQTGGHRAFVRRRLFVNTGASIAANVWAIAVSVITVPLMLAGLGVEAFGVWALIQTFSAVTGWFSLVDLGISVSGVRAIAAHDSLDEPDQRDVTIATTIWFFVALGVSSGIAFALGATAVVHGFDLGTGGSDGTLDVVLLLVSIQIAIDLAARSFVVVLEGLQRVDAARGLDVVRRTLVAVSGAAAATTSGTLTAVARAGLAASVVSTIVSIAIYRRVSAARVGLPSTRVLRQLLRAGVSIAVLRPLGVIHRTMDRIVVGILVGPAAVAAVELATLLQNAADAVLSASSYSVTPSASYLEARGDEGGVRELLIRATRFSLLLTLPIAVSIVILSSPIIDVWIGEDAPPDSAFLASIAAVYIIEVSVAAVASNVLLGVGRGSAVLRAAATSIVVNLVLSIWLGREFGRAECCTPRA